MSRFAPSLAWPVRTSPLTGIVVLAGGFVLGLLLDAWYIQRRRKYSMKRRVTLDDDSIKVVSGPNGWWYGLEIDPKLAKELGLYPGQVALPVDLFINEEKDTSFQTTNKPIRIRGPLQRLHGVPPTMWSMYVQGRFVNPFPGWRDKTLYDFMRWQFTRKSGNALPGNIQELIKALPIEEPAWDILYPSPKVPEPKGMDESWYMSFSMVNDDKPTRSTPVRTTTVAERVTVTWMGQSTCYVQLPGLNILTDPIFQNRTVTSWLGPKRLRPVPCQLNQLLVDIVLVSHNHYDHLEVDCVKALGNSVVWFVPLGLRDWFVRMGVYRVVEMDWWQYCDLETEPNSDYYYRICATPSQHWSGRTLLDSNRSLWSSWFVRRLHRTADPTDGQAPSVDRGSFFHCGDTGYYAPLFRTVRDQLGPVTLAALPIGSYAPRWYMCHQHINPADAVLIHRDLGARRSVGVHWATFMMSDEPYLAPAQDLYNALTEYDMDPTHFVTTRLGQTMIIEID
ncbi:hypothetical protein IWQ61_005654 [Dispira simplex]|nr:hypothetical protein IWQ61_005654 [Dispira simplex]